jgi:hypothetical protein
MWRELNKEDILIMYCDYIEDDEITGPRSI